MKFPLLLLIIHILGDYIRISWWKRMERIQFYGFLPYLSHSPSLPLSLSFLPHSISSLTFFNRSTNLVPLILSHLSLLPISHVWIGNYGLSSKHALLNYFLFHSSISPCSLIHLEGFKRYQTNLKIGLFLSWFVYWRFEDRKTEIESVMKSCHLILAYFKNQTDVIDLIGENPFGNKIPVYVKVKSRIHLLY